MSNSRRETWASPTVVTPPSRKRRCAARSWRRCSSGSSPRWKFGPWWPIFTPWTPVRMLHAASDSSPVSSPSASRKNSPPAGFGGLPRDAGPLEGEGVDDAAVARSVHQVDLAVGGDLVQLVARGVASLDQVAVLVAVAAHRQPVRQLGGRRAQQPDDLRDAGGPVRAAVDPRHHLAVHQRVRVRVHEARYDDRGAEIARVDVRVAAAGRLGAALLLAADGDDPPAEEQQRPSRGPLLLEGVDGLGEHQQRGVVDRGVEGLELPHDGGSGLSMCRWCVWGRRVSRGGVGPVRPAAAPVPALRPPCAGARGPGTRG